MKFFYPVASMFTPKKVTTRLQIHHYIFQTKCTYMYIYAFIQKIYQGRNILRYDICSNSFKKQVMYNVMNIFYPLALKFTPKKVTKMLEIHHYIHYIFRIIIYIYVHISIYSKNIMMCFSPCSHFLWSGLRCKRA